MAWNRKSIIWINLVIHNLFYLINEHAASFWFNSRSFLLHCQTFNFRHMFREWIRVSRRNLLFIRGPIRAPLLWRKWKGLLTLFLTLGSDDYLLYILKHFVNRHTWKLLIKVVFRLLFFNGRKCLFWLCIYSSFYKFTQVLSLDLITFLYLFVWIWSTFLLKAFIWATLLFILALILTPLLFFLYWLQCFVIFFNATLSLKEQFFLSLLTLRFCRRW